MQNAMPFHTPSALFPVEHRFLDLDGVRIHYVDEGAGDTLLLLHGNPAWCFLYRKIIAALKHDFRCVALDYPGYGMSDAPPIEAPQEVIVKTIAKGHVGAPEGADQPYEVKLQADGVILEHIKKLRYAEFDETTLIRFQDGQFRQGNALELLIRIEKP